MTRILFFTVIEHITTIETDAIPRKGDHVYIDSVLYGAKYIAWQIINSIPTVMVQLEVKIYQAKAPEEHIMQMNELSRKLGLIQ